MTTIPDSHRDLLRADITTLDAARGGRIIQQRTDPGQFLWQPQHLLRQQHDDG